MVQCIRALTLQARRPQCKSPPHPCKKTKKMVIATDACNSSIVGVKTGSNLELLAIQPSGNSFQFREALSHRIKGRVIQEDT